MRKGFDREQEIVIISADREIKNCNKFAKKPHNLPLDQTPPTNRSWLQWVGRLKGALVSGKFQGFFGDVLFWFSFSEATSSNFEGIRSSPASGPATPAARPRFCAKWGVSWDERVFPPTIFSRACGHFAHSVWVNRRVPTITSPIADVVLNLPHFAYKPPLPRKAHLPTLEKTRFDRYVAEYILHPPPGGGGEFASTLNLHSPVL